MKIAVGMKHAKQIYDAEYLRFLRQIGITHTLGFMYDTDVLPSAKDGYWAEDDLKRLVKHFNDNGLQFEAIENFLPATGIKSLWIYPERKNSLKMSKEQYQTWVKPVFQLWDTTSPQAV